MRSGKILVLICCLFFVCLVFCGCRGTVWGDSFEFLRPEGPPADVEVSESYYRTELKVTSAADVLSMVHMAQIEGEKIQVFSQSESIIAVAGEKKRDYKKWLNMVAFDENELTAQRKYLLIVDERPKFLFIEPWEGLMFESQTVLNAEVLEEPYADENARRIAILTEVLESARADINELRTDNQVIDSCGMLINQALNTVLVKLESSPALATRLSDPNGLDFEHTSFDKGRIRMLVEEDNAAIRMLLGSLVKKWKFTWPGEKFGRQY